MNIEILVAVNDRNGILSYYVDNIQIIIEGETALELESEKEVAFDYILDKKKFVKLDKNRYWIISYRKHVGSIVWDSIEMNPINASLLINDLLESGKWQILSGIGIIYDKFKDKKKVELSDFREYDRNYLISRNRGLANDCRGNIEYNTASGAVQ